MSKPLQILVLDEHEDVKAYFGSAFPKIPIEVLTVSAPNDLLTRATSHAPILIFIDGDTPEKAAIVQTLKAQSTTMDIPIVVMSSGNSTDALIDLWFALSPPDFASSALLLMGS